MSYDPNNPNNQPPQNPQVQPNYPQQYAQAQQPVAPLSGPHYGTGAEKYLKYKQQQDDGLFYKIPDQGAHIRIVPVNRALNPEIPEGIFYQVATYHEWEDQRYECPQEILGKACPFCEVRHAVYRNAKFLGRSGNLSDQEKIYAKKYHTRSSYIALIIVRGEEDRGLRLWRFGYNFEARIKAWVSDQFGDITDTLYGHDVNLIKTIKSTSEGTFPNYDTSMPIIIKSPLGTPQQIEMWWNNQPNLASYVLPNIKPYDELFQLCFSHPREVLEKRFGGKIGLLQLAMMAQERENFGRILDVNPGTQVQVPQNYQQPPMQQQYQQPPMQQMPPAQQQYQPQPMQQQYQPQPMQQQYQQTAQPQAPAQPQYQQPPMQQPPAQQMPPMQQQYPQQMPPVQPQYQQAPPLPPHDQQPPAQQLTPQQVFTDMAPNAGQNNLPGGNPLNGEPLKISQADLMANLERATADAMAKK